MNLHIYKSYSTFVSAHRDFVSNEHSHFQDYFEEVHDWLSSQNYNILCCNEDAIIYSTL